jgi:ribosomal protein S18 acetylase RimI-like enzyme
MPAESPLRPDDRAFRASSARDAEAIRALLREANLSMLAPPGLDPPAASGGAIRSAVCEQAGRIVGVLEWRVLGEEIEILELAVDSKSRRRGHASFLLANLLRQAAGPVHLEVRESNSAAMALYLRFGFEVKGRRRGYYRHPDEDALLLSRAPG